MGNIHNLKTSDELMDALRKAASRKLTNKELLEQRVSFVYGSLNPESSVTRAHVKQVIVQQEGGAMESVSDTV